MWKSDVNEIKRRLLAEPQSSPIIDVLPVHGFVVKVFVHTCTLILIIVSVETNIDYLRIIGAFCDWIP